MNKILFSIFTCFVFSLSMFTVMAQSSFEPITNVKLFKQKLNETIKKTNTIQSDFVQEKNLSFMEDKIITKGFFCFKKDNMLRWEYKDPFQYLIIINKNKIYIKDEGQVSEFDMESNKMFKEINNIMLGSVQGNLLNDESKFKSDYFENDKYFLVKMVPLDKNLKKFLSNIHIYFNKKDYSVTRIKMIELSGDYTNIDFQNIKLNATIADEKFAIK